MSKKVIFFDIDGTIYVPQANGISEKVKEAIRKTREKGHLCFIASGRPYGFISNEVKEIGFDGYVLANGANIRIHGKDLHTRFLNLDDLKEMIDHFKNDCVQYVLLTPNGCYVDKQYNELIELLCTFNIDRKNFCFEFDEETILPEVIKLEIGFEGHERFERVKTYLNQFNYDVFEYKPGSYNLEVYSKDISKSTGINDVREYFQIKKENSYCFGDGPNDVEMFETVGHAIAMGNAIDELKERATYITSDADKDGIYNACKHFGWIE